MLTNTEWLSKMQELLIIKEKRMSKFKVGDKVVRKDGSEIKEWQRNDPRVITSSDHENVQVEGVFNTEGTLYTHSPCYLCLATEQEVPDNPKTEWSDKHYNHYYTLTEKDLEVGKIKVDAYFVNRMWKLNSFDDTGAGFHGLKTYARLANNKNTKERELRALYGQVKRWAELEGVDLENT